MIEYFNYVIEDTDVAGDCVLFINLGDVELISNVGPVPEDKEEREYMDRMAVELVQRVAKTLADDDERDGDEEDEDWEDEDDDDERMFS